jgi:hypothetical protein
MVYKNSDEGLRMELSGRACWVRSPAEGKNYILRLGVVNL